MLITIPIRITLEIPEGEGPKVSVSLIQDTPSTLTGDPPPEPRLLSELALAKSISERIPILNEDVPMAIRKPALCAFIIEEFGEAYEEGESLGTSIDLVTRAMKSLGFHSRSINYGSLGGSRSDGLAGVHKMYCKNPSYSTSYRHVPVVPIERIRMILTPQKE